LPAIATGLGPDVVQMHSADYRSPRALSAGPVLVVGGGNTGFQIAEELCDSHAVHLAIGSPQLPLPQRILGRDIFGFLIASGLMATTRDSRMGRRMRDRDSLIGSSRRGARRRGIHLHGRASAAAGTTVTFEDGANLEVATVIWATGFGLDHSWIEAPVFDSRCAVLHERGVTPSPGLYFLGLPWQHTRGSALLGWVKDDAEFLARHIAGRHAQRAQPLLATTA
jgi:putative flavoprotein involved in K+ transport